MDKKIGGAVAGIMTVMRDDVEVEVAVVGHYTPAQNGGNTDPSWSAYVELQSSSIDMTDDETKEAEQMLLDSVDGVEV